MKSLDEIISDCAVHTPDMIVSGREGMIAPSPQEKVAKALRDNAVQAEKEANDLIQSVAAVAKSCGYTHATVVYIISDLMRRFQGVRLKFEGADAHDVLAHRIHERVRGVQCHTLRETRTEAIMDLYFSQRRAMRTTRVEL